MWLNQLTLAGARTSTQHRLAFNAPMIVRGSAGHFYCPMCHIPIPIQALNEAFELDESSHSFLRWKNRPISHFKSHRTWKAFNSHRAGMMAGSLQRPKRGPERYAVRLIDKIYLISRLVYAIFHGKDPGDMEVDHIDGNPKNNNPSNLRLASRTQNVWNRGKHSNNKSGFPGVMFCKATQKWHARIRVNKKDVHLGHFSDINEAARVRNEAKIKYHKEFTRHEANE